MRSVVFWFVAACAVTVSVITTSVYAEDSSVKLTRLRVVGTPEITVTRRRYHEPHYRLKVSVHNVGEVLAKKVIVYATLHFPGKADDRVELKGPKTIDRNQSAVYSYAAEISPVPEGLPILSVNCKNCRK
jgi:hypothetical protein